MIIDLWREKMKCMKQISVKTPAKLNLALDVVGVDERGYHLLEMIMQTIDLYDIVTVTPNDSETITLSCDSPSIPIDQHNIGYVAASRFFDVCNITQRGVHIHLQKKIPQQAGLAGGSTNGAGVLVALNELYRTNLSVEQLCEFSKNIGADIPFCLTGGTALVEGIGEKITKIHDLPDCDFVIAKPKGGISTQRAFSEYDRAEIKQGEFEINEMIHAIEQENIVSVSNQLYNVLEHVCGISEVETIKNVMTSCGAKGALMTGSGSAVFGIFIDRGKAYACEKRLKERYAECFICKPIFHGPKII